VKRKTARFASRERPRSESTPERRTWVRRPIRIDKDELDAVAGVEFSWREIAELVDLCTIYAERFREPMPDWAFAYSWQPPEAVELAARRAFVGAVEGVWRERRRRRGRGSFYSRHARYDGPLVRLLLKLFKAMGEPNPPSAATLHHDLTFLQGCGERNRGGGRLR
jgi:hypothetical protein